MLTKFINNTRAMLNQSMDVIEKMLQHEFRAVYNKKDGEKEEEKAQKRLMNLHLDVSNVNVCKL